jgi:NAD(P)-dependent dehydrogenase (short-subunit alcohol dehydrogenase family)
MKTSLKSAWALAGVVGGLAWSRSRARLDLRGATVVVTGGSRGLGLLLARAFAAAGARIAICARDDAELDLARAELASHGDVLAIRCDVADRAAVERMIAEVEERFGSVDVLVNNASIIQVAPAETLSIRDLQAAMAANFWGTVHATYAVLPAMRRRRRGRIVNVTSIGGTVAVPHLLGYTSAKFAAVGFSSGLAAEVAKDGIVVTTIVPGLMRSGSFLHALVKGRRDAEASLFSVISSLPLVTMDARRAARRIVLACERGESFVTLGLPAKVLRLAHALSPRVTGALFALVARALPGPGGDVPGSDPDPGWRHRRGAGASVPTTLGDRAAAENDEIPVHH